MGMDAMMTHLLANVQFSVHWRLAKGRKKQTERQGVRGGKQQASATRSKRRSLGTQEQQQHKDNSTSTRQLEEEEEV
jgi:hypothetical protein